MTNGQHLSHARMSNMPTPLAEYLSRQTDKKIRIMAHQILGYPDFETNYKMISLLHQYGIDLIELQIPFSEPIADGPIFLRANQGALERGTTVEQCLAFAERVVREFNIPFIFMTYYNVLYQYGVERFVEECAAIGVSGLIVPDAYPEESEIFLRACRSYGVEPILLVTPYTTEERFAYIASQTGGMLYCVARKGLTGTQTIFDEATTQFLGYCREHALTPIGVGFGIQQRSDVEYLIGKSDIAIIGSQLLKLLEEGGLRRVEEFMASLAEL
jgi:tryptophan synthase alpha chain